MEEKEIDKKDQETDKMEQVTPPEQDNNNTKVDTTQVDGAMFKIILARLDSIEGKLGAKDEPKQEGDKWE